MKILGQKMYILQNFDQNDTLEGKYMKFIQPKLIKIVFFSTENNQKLKNHYNRHQRTVRIWPFLPKVAPLCPKIGPKPWAVDKSSLKE